MRHALILLALSALTLGVYWPVAGFEFVNYDDAEYVSRNRDVLNGLTLDSVREVFSRQYMGIWLPVTMLSYQLDVTLFGAEPGPLHRSNLILHLLNGGLLYGLMMRWVGRMGPSALVAAIFLLHPLHVESVAWVAERKDLVCGTLWLLSLLAYTEWGRAADRRAYLLSILFFALAMMSKPIAITLPCLLLLLDVWPLRRLSLAGEAKTRPFSLPRESRDTVRRLVIEKTPYFAIAAAGAVVTVAMQRAAGALQSTELLPLSLRLQNAVVAYATYLAQSFFPRALAVHYPHPGESISIPTVIACGVLLAVVSFAAVRTLDRAPWLFVGWFWFAGMLVPVIGIVQVGGQAMADRYAYLPQIGLSIALVIGLNEWSRGRGVLERGALVAMAGLIAMLALVSSQQVQYWRDSGALWTRALAVTKDNHVAHANLGEHYHRLHDYAAARRHFEACLDIEPHHVPALVTLGSIDAAEGHRASATRRYRLALERDPENAVAHMNLGNTLARSGDIRGAAAHFERAVASTPDYALAHANLAQALGMLGDEAGAERHLEAALRLDPALAPKLKK